MKFPQLDKRTKEDLLESIKNTSVSYVPEWRFNEENKDVGTTLAYLFADLFADTIQRFNKTPEKNLVEFFSCVGAKIQPAIPSKGYASFQMVNDEVEGTILQKGTKIQADHEDGQSELFETLNTVYAGTSSLKCIYQEDGKQDTIYKIFDQGESLSSLSDLRFFSESGKNLQRHIFYIGHEEILRIKGEAEIIITFIECQKNEKLRELMPLFAQKEIAKFSYSSLEGYQEFEQIKVYGTELHLYKGEFQPEIAKTQIEQVESFYIRCEVFEIAFFEAFHIQKIFIASKGSHLKPDQIITNGEEQELRECYPFGEKFTPYMECYFCCDDALWKAEAKIELSFHLDYIQVPIDSAEPKERDWKFIMKESDFALEPEYDIEIEEVAWEYYNGTGFCRLNESKRYEKIFQLNTGTLGRKMIIQFECPSDLNSFLVGAKEYACIRARIIKVKNQYKLLGHYLTPFLSNIRFAYEYKENTQVPVHLFSENRMELTYWNKRQLLEKQKELLILSHLKEKEMVLYLGFDIPPEQSLLRYLVVTERESEYHLSDLSFSFWNGTEYRNLSVIDGTEGLRKTGILTLLGAKGFQKTTLFQQEYFWIRIHDLDGIYRKAMNGKGIGIQGIYENAAEILAVESMDEEMFEVSDEEKNPVFELLYKPVYDGEVWVLEESLTEKEIELLKKQKCLEENSAQEEYQNQYWVKWKEVEHFMVSNAKSRHYCFDHNLGLIQFSDGVHGKLPKKQEGVSIRVRYRVGGGKNSSFPAKTEGRLVESKGYVKNVFFPLSIQGGMDQETVKESIARKKAELKHQGRAITCSDFEAMAFEYSRNILKAKCYSGFNSQGKKEAGSIVLAILLWDYKNPTGILEQVKTKIKKSFAKRISGILVSWNSFQIIEAIFARISVSLSVEIQEWNQVLEWKQKILERLCIFLDPVKGNLNGNGWEIGKLPNQTQILNAVKEVQSGMMIHTIRVIAEVKGEQGFREIPLEKATELPFVVCMNGQHEIEVFTKKIT